ncbi:MAG: hypothetical protein ACXU9Z_15205 [Gemmatimonadaceae bacterium]
MTHRVALSVLFAVSLYAEAVCAQASYRNLDAGFPVRVEDATVTERYALDLDFLNFRYDALSDSRNRFLYEPQVSYGMLPRTEVWVRLPTYYREATFTPRSGVAGLGVGAMYQFTVETLHIPALALATELFQPIGPDALPSSYSLKALLTRSFAPGRIHLNASIASYAVRTSPSLTITCPGGGPPSSCAGSPLPPLDGPCSIGSQSTLAATLYCAAPQSEALQSTRMVLPGDIQNHIHWFLGAGFDKAFPLASTLLVSDIFAEKFEGLGRRTDITAEIGARHQFKPQVVIDGGIGRHFRGSGYSTFITLGMTYTRSLGRMQ